MQHLELNNMMPHVSDDIQFDPRLGTYAFLQAISMDLRPGNMPATQILAVNAFWKRLPANIRMMIMQTEQSLVGFYGLKDSDFNIVALAAKSYDSNRKKGDMYDSSTVRVPSPVSTHQSLYDTSYGAYGYAKQEVATPDDKKAHHTSSQAATGDESNKNANAKSVRGSFRGRSNSGSRGNDRGGTRFTFTNSKPSSNYKCFNCGVSGDHIRNNCPLASVADAVKCSKCKNTHSQLFLAPPLPR